MERSITKNTANSTTIDTTKKPRAAASATPKETPKKVETKSNSYISDVSSDGKKLD